MGLWEEVEDRWRRQIEAQMNRLGSMVEGNQKFQAERISDLIEMVGEVQRLVSECQQRQQAMNRTLARIDQLEATLIEVTERLDRHAEFLTVLKKERENGSEA